MKKNYTSQPPTADALFEDTLINYLIPLKYYSGKKYYFLSDQHHSVLMDTDTSLIVYSRLIFGTSKPHSNETLEDGSFIRWNIITGDTIQSLNILGYVLDLNHSYDSKHFILTSRYADYGDVLSRFTNCVSLLDNNLNIISDLYKYDITNTNNNELHLPVTFNKVQFSGDKLYCIGYNWNEIYFWDFINGELNRKLNLGVNPNAGYNSVDIAFTKNNKFVIKGSPDASGGSSLRIWNINSGLVSDSIKFPGNDYRWKLAVCEDSVSFLSGSYDGIIRLFKNPVINSIDESAKMEVISFYPNPTTSTLNIQINNIESGNLTLKLFDIFGREVVTIYDGYANGSLNLNHYIGNISSGTYFLVQTTKSGRTAERVVVSN